MVSLRQLWDLFHLAQAEQNTDVATCFRYAIEAHNRCDYPSVQFWYRQAQMCGCVEPVVAID